MDGEEKKKEIKKSLVEARAFEILFPVYGLSRYVYVFDYASKRIFLTGALSRCVFSCKAISFVFIEFSQRILSLVVE